MTDLDREAKRIVSEEWMYDILVDAATKPPIYNREWNLMKRRRLSAVCRDWREAVGEG